MSLFNCFEATDILQKRPETKRIVSIHFESSLQMQLQIKTLEHNAQLGRELKQIQLASVLEEVHQPHHKMGE